MKRQFLFCFNNLVKCNKMRFWACRDRHYISARCIRVVMNPTSIIITSRWIVLLISMRSDNFPLTSPLSSHYSVPWKLRKNALKGRWCVPLCAKTCKRETAIRGPGTKKIRVNTGFTRILLSISTGYYLTSSKTTLTDYQCVSTGCCTHVAKTEITIDNQHVTKSLQRYRFIPKQPKENT